MSNLNTELLNTLLKNESVDEFFRQLLEDAINDLLQAELSACLGYEKYDSDGCARMPKALVISLHIRTVYDTMIC